MKRRLHSWLALGVVAVGVGIAVIAGLLLWVTSTPPLYSDPRTVSSIVGISPGPEWAAAVERAREVVRVGMAKQSLPGVSVAVGAGGRVIWTEGFGSADLDSRAAVAPDSRFRIGTQSIVLTSAAAGLLIERDRLRLDESIHTYVPSFPAKQWPLTVRQLMGHTAGMSTDGGDEGPFHEICEHTDEGLRLFKDRDLRFQPDTQFRFSSFGWILVSAAIEAAADAPVLDFMRREIFEPLGMVDTKPDDAHEVVPNRVTSYFPRFAADPRYGLHLTRPLDFSCYSGAYVFLSTPADMVRFGLALNGGRLLRLETVAQLQSEQRLSSGVGTGYGLGWDLERTTIAGAPTRWAGHDGTVMGGMVSALITFPERGLVVSVMSNISFAEVEEMAVRIAQAFTLEA